MLTRTYYSGHEIKLEVLAKTYMFRPISQPCARDGGPLFRPPSIRPHFGRVSVHESCHLPHDRRSCCGVRTPIDPSSFRRLVEAVWIQARCGVIMITHVSISEAQMGQKKQKQQKGRSTENHKGDKAKAMRCKLRINLKLKQIAENMRVPNVRRPAP
jgi:hypothetical protein